MATGEKTTVSELSLDLSLLRDQDEVSRSLDVLRDLGSSSSEEDGLEEVVITDNSQSKGSESTRLDLSGLSGSSTASSGPSLSRDRVSTLPSVHQRPFMASEAWGGSDTDSEGRSRRSNRGQEETGLTSGADGVDQGMARLRVRERLINAECLTSVGSRSSFKRSPPRPQVSGSAVAFGSGYVRDRSSLQSSRLYGNYQARPRVLPPFLKAHTRERRFQSVVKKTEKETKTNDTECEMDKIEMPKDFATLHLLARRTQGHLRYKYMAMLNEWISEHGIPT